MAATSTAKILVRDFKNLPALALTGVDTFIFVILISDKAFDFAIVYTVARLIGMAVSLFLFNKKKEYIQSFNIVVEDENAYNKLKMAFMNTDIKYFGRAISTKNLYDKEMIVFAKSKKRSKQIRMLIPAGSYVITSKTRSVELV